MHDIDTLIQRYLEGTLTDREAAQLHELLIAEPELGERLVDHIAMDAMLRSTKPVSTTTKVRPTRRFSFATLTGVAAMAACLALLAAWVIMPRATSDEATTASVAVLTRGVNLEWEPGAATPAPGSPLSPGWLRLKSGLAQIEFYQGARVLIEGPAAIQLVSSGEATCTAGKLSAHVPPQAKGFRINTPTGTIVDLGTEFGLDLSAASAEVHVFKGEVELHRQSQAMQSLKEGQAMSFASASQALSANAAAFASLTELDQRNAASQRSQFERWQASGEQWNSDPALRLRFDFQDSQESRALHNHAASTQAPDASIVGSSWTTGRWPGKRALEFRNISDRVRTSVPGDVAALTMTMWVRVNGLDRSFNSLFMSEGWGERKIHWQITREGKIRLGVAGKGNARHTDYDTPAMFTPEHFGQWTHLAVTFDPAAKEVRHYVNGDLIARLPMKDASPLKPGVAELGNWNDRAQGERVAIRHLSGAMDEFSLYAKALSDKDIRGLSESR